MMGFTLRRATPEDTPALSDLIQRSVRQLQKFDYSSEQIEAALQGVFGVDSQLIADGTYFAVTPDGDASVPGRLRRLEPAPDALRRRPVV